MHPLPALALILALSGQAVSADSINGNWRNPSGSVTVTIAPCGDTVCGTVVEASDKAKADARKGGTTELIGTVLLSHFKSTGTGKWSGKLFVPDMNIRTKARLQQTSADQLKVSGCGPTGLVCQSQLWTRAN